MIYSTCTQNLATLTSAVQEILLRASKLKMGHVTLTTPFQGWYVIYKLGFDTFYMCAKFDYSSLNHSRDIIEVPKFSGSRDPDHAPFKGHFSQYEPIWAHATQILARFGLSACPSARLFVCPALLVPMRLVSHAPAAQAVYFSPQLAACVCRVRPSVHPSHARGHTSQQSYFNI